MKLAQFKVSKYRNIEDSGWVRLGGDLTCIVGKNQSGKTSLLRALHKLNPHAPNPYDIRREWPRGQRRRRDDTHVVCLAEFELTEEEAAGLAEITESELPTRTVHVSRNYKGEIEVVFPEQPSLFPDRLHPNEVDSAFEAMPSIPGNANAAFKDAARAALDEARMLALEGRYSELNQLESGLAGKLGPHKTPNNSQQSQKQALAVENQFEQQYVAAIRQMRAELQKLPTLHARAHEYVVQHLPTFIYMDDYREFQGSALLDQLQSRRNNKSLTPEDETLLMTLTLSGLDLDTLVRQGADNDQETIRERQYDLSDGAKTLTREVAGRWGQAPYRIEFRADGVKFFVEIEQTDKDVGMLPLEEQSKGFRWFFSFDLRFMHESDGSFEGCVLLLDEPGLHLHPGGQKDLLQRLDAYAEKNTLIYTTHLPFLVDLREPDRIRVIHEVEGAATISEDLAECGEDEKLTLQAALGMSLDQSYLVAKRNLVVEGAHDYWLITALSNFMERRGEDGLPDDVMVSAAGGAPDIVPLATFMIGQGLQVVALFDSDDEGRKAEARLREKWLVRYKNHDSATVMLGKAVESTGDVAIEDLFDADYYVRHANVSHADKLKRQGRAEDALAADGQGMLCKRLQRSGEGLGVPFNKGSVAKAIRKDLNSASAQVSEATMRRARALFTAIRRGFGE